LERERPAMDSNSAARQLIYYKDRFLRIFDLKTQKDSPLSAIRMLIWVWGWFCTLANFFAFLSGRPGNVALNNVPRALMYNNMNPAEHNILLTSVRLFFILFFYIPLLIPGRHVSDSRLLKVEVTNCMSWRRMKA
jgi:hypothetical protein